MTKIEWTDETWNPVWGCYGKCEYCYARKIAKRFGSTVKGYLKNEAVSNIINFIPTEFPDKWDPQFKKSTRYVFVGSMSDIAFWHYMWILDMLKVIDKNPHIIFQILTKFPFKLAHIKFPENVWIGISAENQKAYDERIESLLIIEAGKHFVSLEPLHGPVDISTFFDTLLKLETLKKETGIDIYSGTLDWVIAGAETGNKKAVWPDSEWIRDIIAQCDIYDIPFFFKAWPDHSRSFEGKFYNEFPKKS